MTNNRKKERHVEMIFVGSERHIDLSRIVALFVKKIHWWIFKRGKACKHACPFCKYYYECKAELSK